MIEQISGPPLPGVKQHPSGLFVPEELARPREVWTHDEQRLLDRVGKLAAARGLAMVFLCDVCRKPVEKVRRLDGGITLRCDHLDRECQVR